MRFLRCSIFYPCNNNPTEKPPVDLGEKDPCTTHIDADENGKCDVCDETVEVTPPENDDNKEEVKMTHRSEIQIRDPFIYTDKENGCYYMYGTKTLPGRRDIFLCFKSYDLEWFEEPKEIFCGSDINYWATSDYWAPEMHKYKDRYYLFASVKSEGRNRATQIFVCDRPDGNFIPLVTEPPTPREWMCLDGTFFVENGKPYMVFCHEWVQVGDGEIWAVELTQDLKKTVGEPIKLFSASENPYVSGYGGSNQYVTDGPFLWHEDGKVKMIWSSFKDGQYMIFNAEADSLLGEWTHGDSRFDFDGGHAMLFETLDGKTMIALHSPNVSGQERACFYEVE